MLVNATHSAENLAYQLHDYLSAQKSVSKDNVKAFVRKTLLERGLGVYDATDDEVSRLAENSDPWPASYIFADIISRRAQIGWSTHGHSGTYPFSNAKPLSFPLTLHQPSTSTSTPPTRATPNRSLATTKTLKSVASSATTSAST